MSKHFLWVYLPLIFSNVLHMWIVKKDYLSFLKVPVHEKLFGRNKTLRGFSVVSTLNLIFFSLISPAEAWIGAVLGMVYCLSELPNSWVKRRMGIPPGRKPNPGLSWNLLLDKSDSAIGVCTVYAWIAGLSFAEGFALFIPAVLIHFTVSGALVALKVKENL